MGDSAGFMEEEYLLGDDWAVDAFDDLYYDCQEYVSGVNVIEKAKQLIGDGSLDKIRLFMRIIPESGIDALWRSALANDDAVTAEYIIRFAKFKPCLSERRILALSPKMLNLLYGLNVLTLQKIAPLFYRYDRSMNNIDLWISQNKVIENAVMSYKKKYERHVDMNTRERLRMCKQGLSPMST